MLLSAIAEWTANKHPTRKTISKLNLERIIPKRRFQKEETNKQSKKKHT